MDLSIVIPVFNEEQNIPDLYKRIKAVVKELGVSHELIFVDDGSMDNSLELITKLSHTDACVKYIELSRNFGQQIAITAGLDFVTGDRTVIIDADLQDPPELIKELYLKMNEGFNVVYAKRKKRKGESFGKKITAKIFYRTLKSMTSFEIPLDTGDFRIIDKKVVKALRSMRENARFIRGQISWAGFKQSFVEYDRNDRAGGRSGYSYGKMMHFAKDGITSFSDFPLRLVTYMGFLVALVAFIVMMYTLYSKYIMQSAVPGWTSIIISTLFLGGIQLLSIGIIGEYIGRIASNVRNRPLYFINKNNVSGQDEHTTDQMK